MRQRIFISSVQKEFAKERKALGDFLAGDPLLNRFFDVFLFERDVPASDRRPDEIYIKEVAGCDLYIGLLGNEYGQKNNDGQSPTHREFNEATRHGKQRLIFVKGESDEDKHNKMRNLITEIGLQLIRRRFGTVAELLASVYASLINYLEAKELIRCSPWDATGARKATIEDLDAEGITQFVSQARRARNFPLPIEADIKEVLTHMNLLDDGQPTHAAILLFALKPQQFVISSEVKCAHFHGTEVAKPIPSYQVYKGTVFELVDQAVDFVMSKINLWVGTREKSPQVPVEYEIPRDVVSEAIVNAVAHRDYTSNGSVQVMLFADRLEIWNPGTLPATLTLDKLRKPHGSVPGNPLLAEPLYLTKYIERMGTGIRDMIRRCRKAGLPEPEFKLTDGFIAIIRRPSEQVTGQVDPVTDPATGQVTGQVDPITAPATGQVDPWIFRVLSACQVNPMKSSEIQKAADIRHRETFQRNYLDYLLDQAWLERTIPDKPKSRLQKYRLTEKGQKLLKVLDNEGRGK